MPCRFSFSVPALQCLLSYLRHPDILQSTLSSSAPHEAHLSPLPIVPYLPAYHFPSAHPSVSSVSFQEPISLTLLILSHTTPSSSVLSSLYRNIPCLHPDRSLPSPRPDLCGFPSLPCQMNSTNSPRMLSALPHLPRMLSPRQSGFLLTSPLKPP